MNKPNFLYTEQRLELSDIETFEKDFNIKLPKNLKKLLLKFNGGVLEDELENYAFSSIFSIKYGENTFEFNIDVLQITEQHIPREEIPFADDSFGNIFTISTREKDYGSIYFWEMDVGDPRESLAANSLEEFFGVTSFD